MTSGNPLKTPSNRPPTIKAPAVMGQLLFPIPRAILFYGLQEVIPCFRYDWSVTGADGFPALFISLSPIRATWAAVLIVSVCVSLLYPSNFFIPIIGDSK